MIGRVRGIGWRLTFWLNVVAVCVTLVGQAAGEEPSNPYETLTLRGKVVWLAEAMARRFAIQAVPEAVERILAIETTDGSLHPILEDVRGRAFRADPPLRALTLELDVRRYRGSPAVEIIRVYSLEKDGKYELDYWCDICSIVMFERKLCECCQGDIRLRKRKAK